MKKYIAECIGTFVLTFLGCATAMFVGCGTTAGLFATAAAFGLSVIAMAYAIGGISGCHINPAITLGVALSGRMSWKDACGYWIGQVIGALIAGALLLLPLRPRGSRNHRRQSRSRQFRRPRNRSLTRSHPPCLHQPDRNISQPGPFDRSCSIRWRTGSQGSLDIHRRSSGRRRTQRCRLGRDSTEGRVGASHRLTKKET